MMKKRHLILLLFIPFVLYSCNNDDGKGPYSTTPSTKHTLLVYLGIDNNFSDERDKIEVLRKAWKPGYDANLLVYADGQTNTVLVRIHHDKYGNSIADTLKKNEAENSADPEVFKRVCKEAYEGYPAELNGMLVLSHATGWLKEGKLQNPRSRTVIHDREGQLDLWDFAENIPFELDYVIFDACLMAGAEVISEMQGKAKYMVVSPAEILKRYMQYDRILPYLMKSTPDLKGIVDDTYSYATTNSWALQDEKYKALTMTVVDVTKFKAVEQVCRTAFNGMDIEGSLDISKLQQFYPATTYLYTDLGDIVETLRPDLYSRFKTAMDDCIVYSRHTDTYYSDYNARANAINKFSGLTMYIRQARYDDGLNEDYKILKWYKAVFE